MGILGQILHVYIYKPIFGDKKIPISDKSGDTEYV